MNAAPQMHKNAYEKSYQTITKVIYALLALIILSRMREMYFINKAFVRSWQKAKRAFIRTKERCPPLSHPFECGNRHYETPKLCIKRFFRK